ncbi:peroxin [Elasticomyces elasticus]|nr:peroxin [Elasticomyces elasticus]
MSPLEDTWALWDRARDNGLSGPERLALLQQCTASGFTYTNPQSVVRDNASDLVEYIDKILDTKDNTLKVKHIQWFENNSRCALQWDMVDIATFQPAMSGWSYGQFDKEGRLNGASKRQNDSDTVRTTLHDPHEIMIEASRRWFRRNRTNIAIGAGLVGASYLAGQYVVGKIQEARQRMTEDRIAKENLRRRFEQNQEDCTYTVLALLPTIRDEIISALPVEQITEQLQQERQERLKRMGASEAASTDFPSVPASVVDDDSKSLSGSSYVHASQMVGSTSDRPLRPRKSKAQLWQDMKINAITRALTLIYTLSLLTLFTRIQLNLLGRRTYLSSVVALAGGQQSSTISLENRDDDGYDNVYGNDFEVNRKYLTFSWWLLHRGCKQLMQRIEVAVREVFGPVNIREDITLERLSELTLEVRRKIEGATEQERTQMKWLSFLLPPKDEEAFVMHQAQSSEDGDSPPAEEKPTDPLDVEELNNASLRRLLDETSDLIDSPVFCQVLTRVLDAAYSNLVDYRIATESFKATGPAAPGLSEYEPRITEISETKCKLAHILPVFCKQAHVIASGSGELDTVASVAAQEPLGNEYLAAIDRVHDLEAFAAVIYSSNFEYEVAERNAPLDGPVAQAPLQTLEPEAVEDEVLSDEPEIVRVEDVADSVVGEKQAPSATAADEPPQADKPAAAGLEEAWKRALAVEDGEAAAPVPVEDD